METQGAGHPRYFEQDVRNGRETLTTRGQHLPFYYEQPTLSVYGDPSDYQGSVLVPSASCGAEPALQYPAMTGASIPDTLYAHPTVETTASYGQAADFRRYVVAERRFTPAVGIQHVAFYPGREPAASVYGGLSEYQNSYQAPLASFEAEPDTVMTGVSSPDALHGFEALEQAAESDVRLLQEYNTMLNYGLPCSPFPSYCSTPPTPATPQSSPPPLPFLSFPPPPSPPSFTSLLSSSPSLSPIIPGVDSPELHYDTRSSRARTRLMPSDRQRADSERRRMSMEDMEWDRAVGGSTYGRRVENQREGASSSRRRVSNEWTWFGINTLLLDSAHTEMSASLGPADIILSPLQQSTYPTTPPSFPYRQLGNSFGLRDGF